MAGLGIIVHYINYIKNGVRWGIAVMICNTLSGHVGSVAAINGPSLVSLYETSHQSLSQSQDRAGKEFNWDLTNAGVSACAREA